MADEDQTSPSALRPTATPFVMPMRSTDDRPRLCFTPILHPERRDTQGNPSNLRATAPWFKPKPASPVIVSSDMEKLTRPFVRRPPTSAHTLSQAEYSTSSEYGSSDSNRIAQPTPVKGWQPDVRSWMDNVPTPLPLDLTMDSLFTGMGLRAPFSVPLIPSGLITQIHSPIDTQDFVAAPQDSAAASPPRQDSMAASPPQKDAVAVPAQEQDSVAAPASTQLPPPGQAPDHEPATTSPVTQVETPGYPVVIANLDPQLELYAIMERVLQLCGRLQLRVEVSLDSQGQDILTVIFQTEEQATHGRRMLSGETFGGNSTAIVYQLPRSVTMYQVPVI